MKKNSTAFTLFRIILLASVFLWIFQLGSYFLDNNSRTDILNQELTVWDESTSNATRFQSAYSSQFWVIWVALSTRIGMTYSELWDGSMQHRRFYSGISSMPTNSSERKRIRQRLLEENILFMREYFNLSQTDIIDALRTSSDRARTLDNFVNQIELRRDGSTQSIENLQSQRRLYIDELESVSQAINAERSTLEREFNRWSPSDTLQSSDRFISLRSLETELLSDIVFMNQFIRQYEFLNNYNAWIVNTLKVNRQQIIDRTFTVIPNSWSEFLRPLELIIDEDDLEQ